MVGNGNINDALYIRRHNWQLQILFAIRPPAHAKRSDIRTVHGKINSWKQSICMIHGIGVHTSNVTSSNMTFNT